MIAHVGGVPVEETLLPLVSGVGAGLLMARVWIASRLRRPRSPRSSGCGTGNDGGGDEVEDGTTAIIAPSSDRELAGRETGHRHAPHAGPLVDAGVAGGQERNADAGGDQLERLFGVGRLGDDARRTIRRALIGGQPELAEVPGGRRQRDEALVEQVGQGTVTCSAKR